MASVVGLPGQFLNSGVMVRDTQYEPRAVQVPQGGRRHQSTVANVYLDAFDQFMKAGVTGSSGYAMISDSWLAHGGQIGKHALQRSHGVP